MLVSGSYRSAKGQILVRRDLAAQPEEGLFGHLHQAAGVHTGSGRRVKTAFGTDKGIHQKRVQVVSLRPLVHQLFILAGDTAAVRPGATGAGAATSSTSASRHKNSAGAADACGVAAAHGGGLLRGPCGVHGRQPGHTAACRWSLFCKFVRSKPVGRTSFCPKCAAQLLCSSLQGGKVCVVVQNVIRLCGQLCFRRLGVETAAGHFRCDAVPCYDAGHTGFKGCCDHA